MRFIVLFLGSILAFLILKYRRYVRDFIGQVDFAERYLGSGGTNTFIILLGVLTFVLSVMYTFGTLQTLASKFFDPFF